MMEYIRAKTWRMKMKTEYRLILKKNLDEILEDTIEIEDASIMSTPNAKEFEKKIRDYIRGLNP